MMSVPRYVQETTVVHRYGQHDKSVTHLNCVQFSPQRACVCVSTFMIAVDTLCALPVRRLSLGGSRICEGDDR